MGRNLDSTLSTGLAARIIQPAIFVMLTLKSGIEYIWSGIGDFVFNGNTYSGVGLLGSVGAITENSAVKAEGTTIKLSGIGLSSVDLPALGITPPDPPFTPPAGQSVAWSLATAVSPEDHFQVGPDIFNDFMGDGGDTAPALTGGGLSLSGGESLGPAGVSIGWSRFNLPPEIPIGATITGVYPIVSYGLSPIPPGFFQVQVITPSGDANLSSGVYGSNIGSIDGVSFGATIATSLEGAPGSGMSVSFVGLAVYYIGSPLTKASIAYEAMGDVRLGAAAKIYFGLIENGALLGVPYLVFSGTVDKPTINPSPAGSTITLALENRLINLQRATQRRYTAADQHLLYPDDTAFNWVEALNDMSLKEGQS